MVKRKILSVIIALTMVVGMLPLANLEVQAEEVNYTMVLGMSAIDNWNKDTDDLGNTNKIVMGTYDGTLVEWVKLNDAGLMFATSSLGESAFQESGSSYYPDSTLNGVMEALYKDNDLRLTDAEKEAIVSTDLQGDSMYSGVDNLENQFFFPLSEDEFKEYVGAETALAKDSSDVEFWWLRSFNYDNYAHCVWSDGIMYSSNVYNNGVVRPAFNLNLDSVLFTSASEASKSDFDVVESSDVSDTWKLTLEDGNDSFAATLPTIGYIGQDITVNVGTAGTTSEYTQTSAILSDSTDTVVAYGKIGDTTIGNKTFTIPATIAAGTYTLHVFEEQVNGGTLTDYASNVVTESITISAASVPTPIPIWVPTEDDAYRLSFVSGMPVEFTTSQVPYEFKLVNDLQGPLCFDVFHAYRGEYNIGYTYTSYANGMKVYSLSAPITVTLQIPSSLQKENRSYEMICVHQDGNAVVLADLDTNPNTITFTTDKGYAFALCYKD